MNKSELIEKAKELGVEVDEKLTKAQIEELLSSVQSEMKSEPAKVVSAHKKGSIKSKYEDHPKFSKFKKDGK